ncbi:MAG TPA: PIN domain-containing protein [Candidatus Acidoferrales bacterium]|jgi:predicted nucleic acid-binding protein|nr:PIN domain-containing protein [Candidatus Acidoferrales bacterium]
MISFMTLAELDRWVLVAHWGEARRKRLHEYLERFVVLPYDHDLCTKWAEVTVAAQACGRRIDCADAWIAATALQAGAPLITHNRNDYLGVSGLVVITHSPA